MICPIKYCHKDTMSELVITVDVELTIDLCANVNTIFSCDQAAL